MATLTNITLNAYTAAGNVNVTFTYDTPVLNHTETIQVGQMPDLPTLKAKIMEYHRAWAIGKRQEIQGRVSQPADVTAVLAQSQSVDPADPNAGV